MECYDLSLCPHSPFCMLSQVLLPNMIKALNMSPFPWNALQSHEQWEINFLLGRRGVNTCRWQSKNCQEENMLIGPVCQKHFWNTASVTPGWSCLQCEPSLEQISYPRFRFEDEATVKLWSVYQRHTENLRSDYHAAHSGQDFSKKW